MPKDRKQFNKGDLVKYDGTLWRIKSRRTINKLSGSWDRYYLQPVWAVTAARVNTTRIKKKDSADAMYPAGLLELATLRQELDVLIRLEARRLSGEKL